MQSIWTHQFLQGCQIGFPCQPFSSSWCKTTKYNIPITKYQIHHPKYQSHQPKLKDTNLQNKMFAWGEFIFCCYSCILNILTHFVHHFRLLHPVFPLGFRAFSLSSKVMRAPGSSCRLSNYPFSLRKPEKTWADHHLQILKTWQFSLQKLENFLFKNPRKLEQIIIANKITSFLFENQKKNLSRSSSPTKLPLFSSKTRENLSKSSSPNFENLRFFSSKTGEFALWKPEKTWADHHP